LKLRIFKEIRGFLLPSKNANNANNANYANGKRFKRGSTIAWNRNEIIDYIKIVHPHHKNNNGSAERLLSFAVGRVEKSTDLFHAFHIMFEIIYMW
jgi:hypothetical protein